MVLTIHVLEVAVPIITIFGILAKFSFQGAAHRRMLSLLPFFGMESNELHCSLFETSFTYHACPGVEKERDNMLLSSEFDRH